MEDDAQILLFCSELSAAEAWLNTALTVITRSDRGRSNLVQITKSWIQNPRREKEHRAVTTLNTVPWASVSVCKSYWTHKQEKQQETRLNPCTCWTGQLLITFVQVADLKLKTLLMVIILYRNDGLNE